MSLSYLFIIGSQSTDQNKQSLVEAIEPPSEIISTASWVRNQGQSSDQKSQVFAYANTNYSGHQIMNLQTHQDTFGKKFSNAKSTFLDENEEADMLNVNEFNDTEGASVMGAPLAKTIANNRIMKHLPITKESFLNWQKHSMLKSFATSQEASFVSR